MEYWSQEWMPRAYSITWVVATGAAPVFLMIALYSRVTYSLWFQNVENADNAQQVRCVSIVCVSRRLLTTESLGNMMYLCYFAAFCQDFGSF